MLRGQGGQSAMALGWLDGLDFNAGRLEAVGRSLGENRISRREKNKEQRRSARGKMTIQQAAARRERARQSLNNLMLSDCLTHPVHA